MNFFMTDFQGIKAIAALHKRGFLVCNWLFLNSLSQHLSALLTSNSAFWSSRNGKRSWSPSDFLFPSFNTLFIHPKNKIDRTLALALGFAGSFIEVPLNDLKSNGKHFIRWKIWLLVDIIFGSNCRIPGHSFICHWIRIVSIVLCLDLQSLPTYVSEADQSGRVFCS